MQSCEACGVVGCGNLLEHPTPARFQLSAVDHLSRWRRDDRVEAPNTTLMPIQDQMKIRALGSIAAMYVDSKIVRGRSISPTSRNIVMRKAAR